MKQERGSLSTVQRPQTGAPLLAKEETSRWWCSVQEQDICADAPSNRLQQGSSTTEREHYSRNAAKIAAKDLNQLISLLVSLIQLLSLQHHLEKIDLVPLPSS